MTMKTHKLLRDILYSNQKSEVSSVLRDLVQLLLLQNVKKLCGGVLCLLNFQTVSLHL